MPEPENEGGFKVTDKRSFTPEGELREKESPPSPESTKAQDQNAPAPSMPAEDQSPHEEFKMTFETLILSLSSTAMVQMGIIPDPTTNQPAKHLPAAKQTIDILEILQQKTKGNLDESEGKLLENILYELRMIYLEVSQSINVPR